MKLSAVNEKKTPNLNGGLKIHKGKKCITIINTTDNIQVAGTKIEKMTNERYTEQGVKFR